MNRIFAGTDVGRKNIGFGLLLFLVLGVAAGIPLTIDLFGGSLLEDQYQVWKVIHGYGVFLSFINFFFGLCIDRVKLTRRQKEVASWSFLLAGLVGGFGRMTLALLAAPEGLRRLASLLESVCFVLGTGVFVYGLVRPLNDQIPESSVKPGVQPAK